MFLKLLERLGRKKIVLDRGPSHPKYNEAKPWMNRYYVLFRNRPKWFPFNILIHEMLDDDHGDGVHNHLCPFMTIILRGGYYETLKDGKHWRPPGYIGFRSANTFHRVDLKPGTIDNNWSWRLSRNDLNIKEVLKMYGDLAKIYKR